jgi:hypothetical protein
MVEVKKREVTVMIDVDDESVTESSATRPMSYEIRKFVKKR